jgi:hypothetical protein
MQNCKLSPRIFVGPVEISGLVDGVVSSLHEVGFEAEAVISMPHPFQYGREQPISWLLWVWQKIGARRIATSRKELIRKVFFVLAHLSWSWLILFWAAFRFQAFIFLYGTTITNTRFELWLLKKFNCKIIFMGVGSDTRPPYIDGTNFSSSIEDLPDFINLMKITRKSKSRLKLQEAYADYWINAPASAHFHEKRFINWAAIGVPKKIVNTEMVRSNESSVVRVLHSPSNPTVKGTNLINEAINRLKNKGHKIQFIQIQGISNKKVIEELEICDFVVDQVYSDAPMAAFAIEAAFFAKPTIVGGYFSSCIQKVATSEGLPPTYFVHPDDIESAIEEMILNVPKRIELGERAKQFVLERWSPIEVGRNLKRLLNDDVPSHWWADARSFCYLEGFGLNSDRVKLIVGGLIASQGISALQLVDKPDFEDAFRSFASWGSS